MRSYFRNLLNSESGFSLIEILAAIVLLALLVGPFLTMFVQSAKNNQITQNVDDATYSANSEMEALYQKVSQASRKTDFSLGASYNPTTCSEGVCFTKQLTNHFIYIQLKPDTIGPSLEDVSVKVYKSSAMSQLQAQMESVYAWKP